MSAMNRHPHTPVSTYRLQLHAGFTFLDARQMVPYLAALGVTDCYVSPPFTARPGSTHGYDVTNHNELNPELGGWAGFDQLAEALAHEGLGLLVDFVPNHMGNDARTNGWWRDVLENGPSSPFARVFDIDWDPLKPELKNRLLLPILGEPYGEALEQGLLRLGYHEGALVLHYGEHQLPINPRRGALVLESGLDALTAALGEDHRQLREFLSILTALRNLPPYTVRDTALVTERQREKEVTRERLARLVAESEPLRRHVDAAITSVNGVVGDPRSFDALHDLLEQQAYRLAYWRTAADEINYRRFFDVNDLAGLRVEDPGVFDHIHEMVLQLVADGKVTGLRLDHIDGLADPAAYLVRLRASLRQALQARHGPDETSHPFYVVVEKILSGRETLPEGWAVAGTTGYNFLNEVNGLFVDGRHKRRMLRVFERLTGETGTLDDVVYESKRLIVGTALSSEFQVLASAVNRLSESHRGSRDFTLASIRRTLREVVACFPVYRTYVTERGTSPADRVSVAAALAAAQARNPAAEPTIFAFLERVLLPTPARARAAGAPDALPFAPCVDVARKFQQYTAPVQAKGVEDTAFYRYNVLLSLNEVGGDPERFGRTVDEFHAANAHRRRHWPLEMNATATHDTKRGEDARARLNVLSEIPGDWRDAVASWAQITRSFHTRVSRKPAPDRSDEYHYYQALLATWPPELAAEPIPAAAPAALAERLRTYMTKAAREAKRHTSWINPNAAYESAVLGFVDQTLTGDRSARFLEAFVPFARRVSRAGAINSLGQLVLKLVSPGVPDFYQGTELWDLTLVDPDNRRPVDYAQRRAWLADIDAALSRTSSGEGAPPDGLAQWLENWPDGRIKLFITAAGLRLRREIPAAFIDGEYAGLSVEGLRDDHIVACGRAHAGERLLAIVPRLVADLAREAGGLGPPAAAWSDTRVRLPDGWRGRRWVHVFTGQTVAPIRGEHGEWLLVSHALEASPVALLRALPVRK
ncbi:MAG: malto-oligosyltrehalose synthase [Acidobacteria bacterium]|nr:malto-oligosyltrehalose synthase [Acidobacteriota bacterium]